MNQSKVYIFIMCLMLSGCVKNGVQTSIKPTGNEQTAGSYSLNSQKTEEPKSPKSDPMHAEQNAGLSQKEYLQFIEKTDPSIIEMDVLFYQEIDADEDGNIEIIATFGHKSTDTYGYDSIEASFVLRDTNGSIQLVKQNFCIETGYSNHDMQLVQFTGSNQYYMVVRVTNWGNMNGLDIYEVIDSDVIRLESATSMTGVCNAYLSDQKKNGTYGGFVVEQSSYDVLYYGVTTFYAFTNGSFEAQDSKVAVGAYPETPTEVVVQYLSLESLGRDYHSSDIANRISETCPDGIHWNIDQVNWDAVLYNYVIGMDSTDTDEPRMTVEEIITASSAKVIVHLSNMNADGVMAITFDLIFQDGKWCIFDLHETDQLFE